MSSTITVVCWGCNQSETHPMKHYAEYAAQISDLTSRGWLRRGFGPSSWDKGPWFCSQECAYESYNVKRAEAWWASRDDEERQKQFLKYCRETAIPKVYFALFGLFLAVVLSLLLRGLFL